MVTLAKDSNRSSNASSPAFEARRFESFSPWGKMRLGFRLGGLADNFTGLYGLGSCGGI